MVKRINSTARLASLRAQMKERGVDIYIIPSGDSHCSEYIASCDARMEFISGFSGSAGCAVVTLDKAALETDGRYFNQASGQLDSNWIFLKKGIPGVPTWQEWAADQAAGGKVVAVDPALIASPVAAKLAEKFKRSGGRELRALAENLVDRAWGSARPARPSLPITVHRDQFAGEEVKSKLGKVRKELEKKKSLTIVISALDDLAWLFNLRGTDIPFNPVFFAYATVTAEAATLYVDKSKLDSQCQSHLASSGVQVQPYEAIFVDIGALARASGGTDGGGPGAQGGRFLISTKASWALKLALGGTDAVDEVRSPIGDLKAVKNSTELDGMRACHLRDGVAKIRYLAWLEDQLVAKKTVLDEVTAADKLEELRAQQPYYAGLSFPTISSTGANAAIIHYLPQRGACSVIDPDAVYLCDSGAQYLDGTTDTTRTVHFGKPSEAEKRAYTLVLRGLIALHMAIFPRGTMGASIDCLARQFLRRDGLDYRHSTGHGVGSFLNVHELPVGIGAREEFSEVPLQMGNVTSIEPGYYEDGAYGVRIENVAIVIQVDTPNQFGGDPYLGFENVTMVPFCRNLIDPGLLTDEERAWLNDFNARVFERTGLFVEDDAVALDWLTRETRLF